MRGIRGQIPLLDGGYITRPEFARYDLNSKWIIENHGVQPDIVVENRPEQVVNGKDPQLEKAIEVVMKSIQDNPKKLAPRPPDLPAYPDRPGNVDVRGADILLSAPYFPAYEFCVRRLSARVSCGCAGSRCTSAPLPPP